MCDSTEQEVRLLPSSAQKWNDVLRRPDVFTTAATSAGSYTDVLFCLILKENTVLILPSITLIWCNVQLRWERTSLLLLWLHSDFPHSLQTHAVTDISALAPDKVVRLTRSLLSCVLRSQQKKIFWRPLWRIAGMLTLHQLTLKFRK